MVLSEGTTEKIPSDTTGDWYRDRPTSSAAPIVGNLQKEANSIVKISFIFYIDKLRHRGNLVQNIKNSEYLIQRKYNW